jgi:putative GTP pyrophosphokinase
MENIDESKVAYIFEGLSGDVLPEKAVKIIRSFIATQNLYSSAIREITTKLENLNEEFKYTKDRNPIQHIKSRIKSPKSIMNKLKKKGFDLSVEPAKKNIMDIAGVRVICSYLDDIYLIADLLTSQDDVEVIRRRDFIANPKANGYRSLHLIVSVPIFLSDRTEKVKVEIQIRTIAMDFWASLEHELAYKLTGSDNKTAFDELKACAKLISDTDHRMQNLHNSIVKN